MSTRAIIFDATGFGYLLLIAAYLICNPNEEQLNSISIILGGGLVALVVGAGLGYLINKLGIKTLGQFIFESAHEKVKAPVVAWFKTFWGFQLAGLFSVTCIVGVVLTGFSLNELFHEAGFNGAKRIFSALLDPEWSLLPRGFWAIIETIYIAFMSTVIAVPLAFVLSFLCARNIMQKNWPAIVIYNLLRIFM